MPAHNVLYQDLKKMARKLKLPGKKKKHLENIKKV